MTEQIKSAIEQIQTEMIKDIDIPKSAKTELANQRALHLAIRSLQAWEEVLQELEEERAFEDSLGNDEARVELDMCIRIINQKLSDVPDNNVGEIEK